MMMGEAPAAVEEVPVAEAGVSIARVSGASTTIAGTELWGAGVSGIEMGIDFVECFAVCFGGRLVGDDAAMPGATALSSGPRCVT